MSKKSILPGMLNYAHSITPSNGFFYVGNRRMLLETRSVSGATPNYSEAHKEESPDEKKPDPNNANIQMVDACYLPPEAHSFLLECSLTFMGNTNEPGACNDAAFAEKLKSLVALYKEKAGFSELARRYAENIVNARWMWRNGCSANKQVTVYEVCDNGDEVLLIKSKPGHHFEVNIVDGDMRLLVNKIATSLGNEAYPLRLKIQGSGMVGGGQEVYPSQVFDDKSKHLFSVPCKKGRHAAMQSQQIGSAIRTIDTWYPGFELNGPLVVEPLSVDQKHSKAWRVKGDNSRVKTDLCSYLVEIDEMLESLESASGIDSIEGHIHYVMACLVRGGVFSGESKKEQ